MPNPACLVPTTPAFMPHFVSSSPGRRRVVLALRCLAMPPGALVPHTPELLSDDQVIIEERDGRPCARPPPSIRGLIEVRGVGIVQVPAVAAAELVLLVDIVPRSQIERLPDPSAQGRVLRWSLPRLPIWPFEASAPIKLLLALQRLTEGGDIPSCSG